MKIFFSAGEPSGDMHGANLIRAIRARRSDAVFVGYGGPLMAEAGCRLHVDLTTLAVMGLSRVLLNLHKFLHLVSRADRYFRHHRPDAVVLIDFPGFNWWIARRAKAHGIPVFYYVPPQIWAWATWRIKKMRRYVDHILCSLPFEEAWYAEHGCRATFVGHPYFDQLRSRRLDEKFLNRQREQPGPLVTILPGSRTQEVEKNLHWFLKAAAIIKVRAPEARFAIAAFKPRHAVMARKLVAAKGLSMPIYVGRTAELISAATCCMAVSGSVSLELLGHAKPTVVLYWISRVFYFIHGFVLKVPYITLVNLLATGGLPARGRGTGNPARPGPSRALFPEYVTCQDRSYEVAAHVIQWLTHEPIRQQCVRRLEQLRRQVGHDGASRSAAEYLLRTLEARPRAVPRPHFKPGMVVASSGQTD
jgi:lipid-A-disaccharide synthase